MSTCKTRISAHRFCLTPPMTGMLSGEPAHLPLPDGIISGSHPLGSPSPMTDVTQILNAIEEGDPSAAERLLPLVYEELRRLAAEKMH